MEKTVPTATHIVIGDIELWTAPFGANMATLTAQEGGLKKFLLNLHENFPEDVHLMVDDEDFCEEDMDGAFSVIVNPETVMMMIKPGSSLFRVGVRTAHPESCQGCQHEDECHKEEHLDE